MSVSLYFGLPGSGKTTLMCYHALKYSKRGLNVYSNVGFEIPNLIFIDNKDIGKYNFHDGVLLIDEGTLFADSRDYKSFDFAIKNFFMLHRHYKVDIIIYTQGWDTMDKRIRQITDRVYYVYKSPFTAAWITKFYRVPYGIIIPNPKKDGNNLGEIIQGYCKPSLLQRVFCGRIFRPKYYKYFDSWSVPPLPLHPNEISLIQIDKPSSHIRTRRNNSG